MLSFSGSLKVLVALEPCDMRKGFNGLYSLVTERLAEDPREGTLFVFINRRHTRLKILCWDGIGLWGLTKYLAASLPERGRRCCLGEGRKVPAISPKICYTFCDSIGFSLNLKHWWPKREF